MGEKYTITKRYIEFDETKKYPLGRHVNHDSRSRAYAYRAPRNATVNTVFHNRWTPILDQGDIGSCTGNAVVGAVGTEPFKTSPDVVLNEKLAVSIYSKATVIDDYAGTYPPDDTGSDGLSVAKIAKNIGLISGYQHTFTLNDALVALQTYPVITGVNWYDSFYEPGVLGKVTISPNAVIAGGHEFVVYGVDSELKRVYAANSWGLGWGVKGTFNFSFDDWERLLGEEGDVCVLLPLSVPAPVPFPVPVPLPVDPSRSADDILFARQLRVNFIGKLFYKGTQRYAQTWMNKKGL